MGACRAQEKEKPWRLLPVVTAAAGADALWAEPGNRRGGPGRADCVHGRAAAAEAAANATHHSSTTLPDMPERITSKPFSNSAIGKRWVMTGETSSPLWIIAVTLYQVSNISRP